MPDNEQSPTLPEPPDEAQPQTNTWLFMLGGVGAKRIKPLGTPSVIRTNREPKKHNTSKNGKMLELWEEGYTVNQIAEIIDTDNYAVRRILRKKGIIDPLAKPMVYPVRIYKFETGELLGEYPSINECCRAYSLNRASVQRVLNGEFKQTSGYFIEYVNKPNPTKVNKKARS